MLMKNCQCLTIITFLLINFHRFSFRLLVGCLMSLLLLLEKNRRLNLIKFSYSSSRYSSIKYNISISLSLSQALYSMFYVLCSLFNISFLWNTFIDFILIWIYYTYFAFVCSHYYLDSFLFFALLQPIKAYQT